MSASFEINGRTIRPDQMGNELEKMMLKQVQASVEKVITSVYCSEHHRRPTVKVVGRNVSNLNFEVSGCCQGVIDQATNKLK